MVDFKRRKQDMQATVERIEYDPNRTAFIALLTYEDGEQAYILAPQRLAVGDKVLSGPKANIKPGNALPIANIPVGTLIHNVEMKIGKGGQLARSAGPMSSWLAVRIMPFCVLPLARFVWCVLNVWRLSVRYRIRISRTSRLVKLVVTAGLGKRPHVRGVVMNPIDHPHGGGEGRTSGGRHPVTPWGKPTKGKRTRNNKKTDRMIVRRRKP